MPPVPPKTPHSLQQHIRRSMPGYQEIVDIFSAGQTLDYLTIPGIVAGDSGKVTMPFTVEMAGYWELRFFIANGGGKMAIDNLRISRGGVGPWRRDFENGLVLVNPLRTTHIFSTAELGGLLHRTGIRRIKGNQAPEINTGQTVNAGLSLQPFDAIILLADPIDLKRLFLPLIVR